MKRFDRIEIFRTPGSDDWWWRRRAPNGRIIAVGAEPFATQASAQRAAARASDGRTLMMHTVNSDGTLGRAVQWANGKKVA